MKAQLFLSVMRDFLDQTVTSVIRAEGAGVWVNMLAATDMQMQRKANESCKQCAG